MDELVKHREELKLRKKKKKHLTDSWRPGTDPRSTRGVSSSEHKLFPSGLGERADGLLCQAASSQRADGKLPLRRAGGETARLDVQEAAVKDLSTMMHKVR